MPISSLPVINNQTQKLKAYTTKYCTCAGSLSHILQLYKKDKNALVFW